MEDLTRDSGITRSVEERNTLKTELHVLETLTLLVRNRDIGFLSSVGQGDDIRGLVDAAHEVASPTTNGWIWICLIECWVITSLAIS